MIIFQHAIFKLPKTTTFSLITNFNISVAKLSLQKPVRELKHEEFIGCFNPTRFAFAGTR